MKRHLLSLALAALTLSACSSWFDSNQPYLQTSSNLIPGERVVANSKTTAYAISKKYNVPMNDLIVLNRLSAPFVIWPGQEVILPANAGRTGNLPAKQKNASNYVPGLGSNAVAVSQLPPPTIVNQGDARFIWPVEGPILQNFGPRNSGGTNDGINIGAQRGAPVIAAASGVVMHASNQTKSFGNLVLIRHGDGYITAYAHLDRMIVDKDSVIAKGDMIGTVGSTGDVKGPQLHFEVRKDGKPIDPIPLMPTHAEPNPY